MFSSYLTINLSLPPLSGQRWKRWKRHSFEKRDSTPENFSTQHDSILSRSLSLIYLCGLLLPQEVSHFVICQILVRFTVWCYLLSLLIIMVSQNRFKRCCNPLFFVPQLVSALFLLVRPICRFFSLCSSLSRFAGNGDAVLAWSLCHEFSST